MMTKGNHKLERIEYRRGRAIARVTIGIYAPTLPAITVVSDIMSDYPYTNAYYGLMVNISLHLAKTVADIDKGVIAEEFKPFAPKTKIVYFLRPLHAIEELEETPPQQVRFSLLPLPLYGASTLIE